MPTQSELMKKIREKLKQTVQKRVSQIIEKQTCISHTEHFK